MNSIDKILHEYKKICWYPSAGADFRILLYLSKQYCEWKNVNIDTDELPDLFILTDCYPQDTQFAKKRGCSEIERLNGNHPELIYSLYSSFDGQTRVTVTETKELESLEIPCSPRFYKGSYSRNYGRAFLMKVHIRSEKLGEWDTDVLYLLAENTAFAFEYLIPGHIQTDYIVRVRYGESFGGSCNDGSWLLKLIKPLNVKYFLSKKIDEYSFTNVPETLKKEYPDLKNVWDDSDVIPLEEIYVIDKRGWSDQDDTHWYKTL